MLGCEKVEYFVVFLSKHSGLHAGLFVMKYKSRSRSWKSRRWRLRSKRFSSWMLCQELEVQDMKVLKLKIHKLGVQEPKLWGEGLEGVLVGHLCALGWWKRLECHP